MLCSDKHYDKTAPTKQNFLCNNKAPIELVKQETEENHLQSSDNFNEAPFGGSEVTFTIHKQTRIVLILDLSASMAKHWEDIRNSLHRYYKILVELCCSIFIDLPRTNNIRMDYILSFPFLVN